MYLRALRRLLSVCFLGHSLLQAGDSMQLDSLVLFSQGGVATRSVVVEAVGDRGLVTIDGLPRLTEESGIQVRLKGQPQAFIGSYYFERIDPKELDPGEIRLAIESEIQRLQAREQDLLGEVQHWAQRVNVFGDLRKALLEAIAEGVGDLEERLWDAVKGEQEAERQRLATERQTREALQTVRVDLEAARRWRDEVVRREAALNGRLTVEIVGPVSPPVQIELVTPFRGGGWEPFYRWEAQPTLGRWVISYHAHIRNPSGEAWEQVPVTLMTNPPRGRTQAPELSPVFLDNRPPAAPVARAMRTDLAMESAETPALAAPPAPEVEATTVSFAMKVPTPIQVPAESGRRIRLAQVVSTATFWSAATPMLDPKAYLHGAGELMLEWPLLPGPVTLLVDGVETGSGQVAYTHPGERVEIGFGENPAIQVEFRAMDQSEGNRGIIDRARVYQRRYEATVTNRMPVEHEVRVQSRFPIPRDNQITVRRLAPSRATVSEESGIFIDSRFVPSGGSDTFVTEFEVRTPRDWILNQDF